MFPGTAEILQSLEKISNELLMLALIVHLLVFCAAIALFNGWRPYNKIFGSLLALLLLSVSVVSFLYGNMFNGSVFLVAFALAILLFIKTSAEKLAISKGWVLLPAFVLLVFGWIYPHFTTRDLFSYAYFVASPLGLIPCPTLALIIGFTLLFNGIGSRKWSFTLAVLGLFYGIFGVWKLNIVIDSFLIAGSLILLYFAISLKEHNTKNQKSVQLKFN